MDSLLAVIGFDRYVLEEKFTALRRPAVHLDGVCRQRLIAVGFHRGHTNRTHPGVVDETLQRRHLGAAGTAHAPGLFEHATALFAIAIYALSNVVVAPRRIETRIGFIR